MGYIDGKWIPVIMMIVISIILGIVNALIKHLLDGGVGHMVIATYRLALSTVFLAPIAYFLELKTRPKMTLSIFIQLFFSALLGSSLTQYFFLLGLGHTSASMSSAFWSIMPALTFVMALLCRYEKINMKTKAAYIIILGILTCVGGAMFLTLYKGVSLTGSDKGTTVSNTHVKHHNSENYLLGSLLLLAGVSFFSCWMLVQAKINVKYPSPYSSTVLISLFGTIQAALLSLINTRDLSHWVVKDHVDLITLFVAGVIGQGVCTVGMLWCIRQQGPVVTSIFSPISLMSATLFDYLVFGTPIHLGSVIGSIVIVIGLYTFIWGKTKQMKETAMVLPVNVSNDDVVEVEGEVQVRDKDEETKEEKHEKDGEEKYSTNKEEHVVVSMSP